MNEMEKIRKLLECKTIAVVGFSKDPLKDANRIPMFLKQNGFEVIPINPTTNEINGMEWYPSISKLPEEIAKRVELIDIFRPSQDVEPIVQEAIELKEKFGQLKVVWMQLGIENETAAKEAENAGLIVVQDSCMKIEYSKLL